MENGYNFDYLTLTVKDITVNDFLGIVCESFPAEFVPENFVGNTMGAVTGYNRSMRYLDEKYITISWWEAPSDRIVNPGRESICLKITGQGFAYLVPEDIAKLMNNLKECGIKYNVTRLDICYNDFDGTIPKKEIIEAFRAFRLGEPNIVTNINGESVKIFSGSFQKKEYENITIGSRQSKKLLRIYDKKAEQKIKSDEIKSWERMEIQLNKGAALQYMEYWLETKNFGQGFVDTLNDMFRIVEVTSDSNKARNKTVEWYDQFLNKMIAEKGYFANSCSWAVAFRKFCNNYFIIRKRILI